MSKRKLTRRQSWRIEKIQEERKARAHKLDSKISQCLENGSLGPEQMGIIIAHYGTQLIIEPVGEQGERYRCYLRRNLPPLVTGDRVVWRSSDNKDTGGVVVALGDRNNLISRPDSRGQLKPVAANVDYMIVVIAPVPVAYSNLIDRYLVAAEHVGITPVILLNKMDLLVNDESRLVFDTMLDKYKSIPYSVITASTQTEHGLDELKQFLKDRTSVFVGQSGVGKSSLVNVLLPNVDTKVGPLSGNSGKGTHTTSSAQLFHFPAGGSLIDSPGVREFGLWHMEPEDVFYGFKEFRSFLGRCKFRNCCHKEEPGCAIRQALSDGDIHPERLDSYESILNSL